MQELGRDYKRFCSSWRVAASESRESLILKKSPWQVHGAREWISQQRDSPIVASQVATIPPCPSLLSDKGKPAAVAMAVLYAKKAEHLPVAEIAGIEPATSLLGA